MNGCPSCDRDLSYPGAPGHECYTYAEAVARRENVLLIGGAFDRQRADLLRCPPRIQIGRQVYEAINDPDTGDFLGAYCHRD